jgi:hypothetical protein
MQREPVYEALQRRSALRFRAPRRAGGVPHPVVARVRAALLQRRMRPPEERQLIAEARTFALSIPAPVRLQVCVSLDGSQSYVYAWMEAAAVLAACTTVEQRGDGRSARLAPISEWQGASAHAEAPYHYVVATDVDDENDADFNRWYDTEHLPGLAAVPGAVHCARLSTRDGGPRYHACYDLTAPEVLDCAEWQATRRSAWSSRVRPHFKNPRRIMFRTLLDERRLAVSSAYF